METRFTVDSFTDGEPRQFARVYFGMHSQYTAWIQLEEAEEELSAIEFPMDLLEALRRIPKKTNKRKSVGDS